VSTDALDQAALNSEVAKYVARGYAVESSAPGQVILSKKARIGVFWNIVLSILTGGLWLVVVAFKLINRKTSRVALTVNENGQVVSR
jgi:hypothetical protein